MAVQRPPAMPRGGLEAIVRVLFALGSGAGGTVSGIAPLTAEQRGSPVSEVLVGSGEMQCQQ